MRTEKEIYHRLRWDRRFDTRRCSIVYTVRPSGTLRVPFLQFASDVIPWHRIVEFWIGDALVWSRPHRIDRLDEHVGDPVERRDADTLRVLTWNLLFDRYDAEKLQSEARWQDALDRMA